MRVYVLHNSSGTLESEVHAELKKAFRNAREDSQPDNKKPPTPVVVIDTYGKLRQASGFVDYQWHYVVLDEGHQIRNPDAKLTIAAKHLQRVRKFWCHC